MTPTDKLAALDAFNRALTALALELPERIYDDFLGKWRDAKAALTAHEAEKQSVGELVEAVKWLSSYPPTGSSVTNQYIETLIRAATTPKPCNCDALVKALEFYANKDHIQVAYGVYETYEITEDGEVAREALAAHRAQENNDHDSI